MLPYLQIFIFAMFFFIAFGNNKKSSFLLAILFIYISLFIGLGDMIGGYDRYIYGEAFDAIADTRNNGEDISSMLYLVNGWEYGYFAWEILISHITANRYIFILATTFLVYFLYFIAFRKYINDYPLACIVFLGFLYYFTMTYLRQVIAVGFVWQSIRYIWKRKPIPFFFFIVLASSFHNSALLFSIMYFLPIRKYSRSLILFVLIICLIIGASSLPESFISSASDLTSKTDANGDYADQLQGFRIEYVLEVLFFIIITFSHYRKIDTSPQTLTFLNMTFCLCAILLFFMRFGQGGRFAWPFLLGAIYTLTYIADLRVAETWVKPVVVIVCFALFMRITIAWAPLNAPYKTFLTNGEPAGNGSIYHKYEYDYNYTVNKLYR